MKLVPLSEKYVQLAHDLFVEGLDWSVRSQHYTDPTIAFRAAVDSPLALWRICSHVEQGGPEFPVGLAGFEDINMIDGTATPYVAIAPQYRQKGLGKRMSMMLRGFGVQHLNLRRIQSTILVDSPSRKILEALDFTLEGTHKAVRYRDGKYVDSLSYAWLKE